MASIILELDRNGGFAAEGWQGCSWGYDAKGI
jgi:hypothetical protein